MKLTKVTSTDTRPIERWYDDACGAAHGLELVGERWSLLVVRELVFGPRRFGELRESLPKISANVLSQRLEGLEAASIVQRRQLPSPANAQVYELTAWGYEAETVLQALGRWAARSPSHDKARPISPASLLLSFRTMLDPDRSAKFEATIGLRFGAQTFRATVARSAISIRRGELDDVDAAVTSDPATLGSVVYGGRSLADAEANGALSVEGNRTLAKRFVGLFLLPPKAERTAGAR